MTALGWGPGPSLIFGVIFIMICSIFTQQAFAAPVYEHETGLEAYHEELNNGCYYNFQHYEEGDRILTNEPCLNCTCHNRMLMCYLRVCPFTKAIGENCKIEKREDQCCPIITCPEVPVHLLTSTTTASPSAETDSTELGHLDNYGCTLNELFYSDGARVPSDPSKPCELCYCIRNKTTCIMQECTLHVQGCKPVYQNGVCCPVRYDCDREEEDLLETTVSSGLLLTTTMSPGASTDCKYNSSVYSDGELIKTENACEHCYCMRGEIVCAVQECGQPMEKTGTNCVAIPREGQCCPEYECDNATFTTTTSPSDELTTALISDLLETESKSPLEIGEAPTIDKLHKADDSGISVSESLPSDEHTTEHIIIDDSSKTPEPVEEETENQKPISPQELDTNTDKYEPVPTTETVEKLGDVDVTSPQSGSEVSVTTSSQPSDEQNPTDMPDVIHSEDTTKYNLAESAGENQILEDGNTSQEAETSKPEISVSDQSSSSQETSSQEQEIVTRIFDNESEEPAVTESLNVQEIPAPSVSKPEGELSPSQEETGSITSEDSTQLAEDIITTEYSKPGSESLEPSTSAPTELAQGSDSDANEPIDVDSDKAPSTQQSIDQSTSIPEVQSIATGEKDTNEAAHDLDIFTSSPEPSLHTTTSSDLETEEHTENKYLEQQTTVKDEASKHTTENVVLTTEVSKDLLPETITEENSGIESTPTNEKDTEHEQSVDNVESSVPEGELPHTTEGVDLLSDGRKNIHEQEVSTELGSEPIVDEQSVTSETDSENEPEVSETPIESTEQPETSEKSIDTETSEKPSNNEPESTEKHLPMGEQIETTISPLITEEQELQLTEKPADEHQQTSDTDTESGTDITPEITTKLYEDDSQLETSEKSIETDDHSQSTEKPIDSIITEEKEPSVTEQQTEIDIQPEGESEKPNENGEIPPYSTEKPSESSDQLETSENPIESDEIKPETSEKPVDNVEHELVTTDKYDTSDEYTIVTEKTSVEEQESEKPVRTDEQTDASEKPVEDIGSESVTTEKPSAVDEQHEIDNPDERIYVSGTTEKSAISEEQASGTEKPADGEEQIDETTEKQIENQEQDSKITEKPVDNEEQVPEISEKPAESTEKLSETTERPLDSEELIPETSEQPTDGEEIVPEFPEKPLDSGEQVTEITEKAVDSTEKIYETSEKPADSSEIVPEVPEIPISSEEQVPEISEKPAEITEKFSETTEKPLDSEEVPETSEKPTGSTEIVPELPGQSVSIEEQVPEVSEQPADVTEKVSEATENPIDNEEQFSQTSEKSTDSAETVPEILEENIDNMEQVPEISEKPADSTEKVPASTEESTDSAETVPEIVKEPVGNEDQVPEISEKPADSTEKVSITSEESTDSAETVPEILKEPVNNEEQVPEISEKPADSTEKVPASTEESTDSAETVPEILKEPVDNEEQVPEISEKPADSTEKVPVSTEESTDSAETVPEILEEPVDNEEQVPEISEKPGDSTEKVLESTEESIDREEQVPQTSETSEKPADSEEIIPEITEKPIDSEQEAPETSEKSVGSEDQTTGIYEKPTQSGTLEIGVTEESKEIEQTPSNEIDQTRDNESKTTEQPSVESVDVQVPVTEATEQHGEVTTHHIKPETEPQRSSESTTELNTDTSTTLAPGEQPSISDAKVTTQSTEISKYPEGVTEISSTDEEVTQTVPESGDKVTDHPDEESQKTEAPIKVETPEVETTENVLLQSEHNAIPGEGDCLVDGVTYENSSIVQPTNPCQLSCKCISSIVQCEMIECSPPPSDMVKCMPIFHGDDNCCPTYNCEGTEAKTPPSDSHTLEKLPEKIPNDVTQTETTPEQVPTKESVPDVIAVVPIENDISTESANIDNNIPTYSSIDMEENKPDDVSPSKDTPADDSTSGVIGIPVDKTESPAGVSEIEPITERFGITDDSEHEDSSKDVSGTTPELYSTTEKSDLPHEMELSSEKPEHHEMELSSEQPEPTTSKHEEPVEGSVELTSNEYPNEILPTTSHTILPAQENEVEASTSIPEHIPSDNGGIDSNEIPSGEISTQPEISTSEIITEHSSVDLTTETTKTTSETSHHDENENEILDTSKAGETASEKLEESYTTMSSEDSFEDKTTTYISEISTERANVQETETEHFTIELGDISTQSIKEIESGEQSNEIPLESTSIPDITQDKDTTSAPIADNELPITSPAEEELPVTPAVSQEGVTTDTPQVEPIEAHDDNEIPTYENIPVQPETDKPLDADDTKSTPLPTPSSDSSEEIPDSTSSIPTDDTRAETLAPALSVDISTEYQEQEVTVRISPDYVTDLPTKVEESDMTTIESEEVNKPVQETESSIIEAEKPEVSVSATEEPPVTDEAHSEVAEISTDTIKQATPLESESESEASETDTSPSVPETQTDKPTDSEANTVPDFDKESEHSTVTSLEETEKPLHVVSEVESTTLAEDRIPHIPETNENDLTPGEQISEMSTSIPLNELTTQTNEIISQTEVASQKPEFDNEPALVDVTTETNEIITNEPIDVQKQDDSELPTVNESTEGVKTSEITVTPDDSQESIEQSSEHLSHEIPVDNRINLPTSSEEVETEQQTEQLTEQPVTVAVNIETSSEQVINIEHTETYVEPEIVSTAQESNVRPDEQVTEEVQKTTTGYLEATTIKTSVEESSEEKQETSSEEESLQGETTESKLNEISTESQPISQEQTTVLSSDNLQTENTPKDNLPESGQENITDVTEEEPSSDRETTTQSKVQKPETSSEEISIANEISGDKVGEPEPAVSVTEVPELESSTSLSGESLSDDLATKSPVEDESANSSEEPTIQQHIHTEEITTENTIPELSTLTSEKVFEPEVTEVPVKTTIKQESDGVEDGTTLESTTISKLPELSTNAPIDNASTEKSEDENVTVHEEIPEKEGTSKPIQSIEDHKQTSDVPSISSQEPDYVQVPIEQSHELSTSGPAFESSTQNSLNVTSPPRIPGEDNAESQKPVKPDYQPQHPDDFGQMPQQYPYAPETDDYDEEDSTAFGPGTCRYGGKVYVSAQQIPRDDPCDFCFCFRSDIICLQQSCPPPIPGCHEEPINGFCCPRYECPVSMATVLNVTTTTTTTTTTLPPHFLHHAYKGAASRRGCQIQGKAYQVGEVVKSKSGPCLHCTCGGDGQMKCDPKVCSPQPMIQQMIAAVATSRTGARR